MAFLQLRTVADTIQALSPWPAAGLPDFKSVAREEDESASSFIHLVTEMFLMSSVASQPLTTLRESLAAGDAMPSFQGACGPW